MEEQIKDMVLEELSSLYKEGNFYNLAFLIKEYRENSKELMNKTPSQLRLEDKQRRNTLIITETVAFINLSLKNIPVEKLIIPTLLSCIELSLWEKTETAKKIIQQTRGYSVYMLPVFIDYYFKTSCISENSQGEVDKIIYAIEKLIKAKKHKETFANLQKTFIKEQAEKEWIIYKKFKDNKWFGITSFVLSREEEVIHQLKQFCNI